MERYLGVLTLAGLVVTSSFFVSHQDIAATTSSVSPVLPAHQPVTTESRFTTKLEEEIETVSKKVAYQDDPEIEAGNEQLLEEGKDGKKVKIYKITFFEDQEYERELVSEEITPAQDKKILRGTKVVWKTLDTADGPIRYWKKMRVYATHYDSRCLGCNEWTAIGMRAGKGVIAVDPKVIPLRSKVYIPGYGVAVAGDTGGAIKGNIIDLGFDDTRTAGWSARFVDIYLL